MNFIKNFLFLLVLSFFCAGQTHALDLKKQKKVITEQTLVNRLEGCLSQKDPYCYTSLWPDIDTLSKIIMETADKSSKEYFEMQKIQNNAALLLHTDSLFKANLRAQFDTVIATGERYGIHWESIISLRYELIKQRQTRDELSEKLAPTRFVGYIFFSDLASRRTYGLMVGRIMQIRNEWYGGEMGELFEANTRDEWEEARFQAHKEKKAQKEALAIDSLKLKTTDSLKTTKTNTLTSIVNEEEAPPNDNKIIVEKKLYVGTFDNEIPVQLYLRSYKGGCPSGICSWDALYKFGDNDGYILLDVTKMPDGKFQFLENPANAVMDLELKAKALIGNWTAGDNQTGYDVRLIDTPASAKKIERLDEAFAELKEPK